MGVGPGHVCNTAILSRGITLVIELEAVGINPRRGSNRAISAGLSLGSGFGSEAIVGAGVVSKGSETVVSVVRINIIRTAITGAWLSGPVRTQKRPAAGGV